MAFVGLASVDVAPAAAAPLATPAQRDSVLRLYRAYFLRNPESSGHSYWAEQFATQQRSLTSIAQFFSQSQEFVERYGSVSDEAFVRLVYTNVLGRSPDSNDLAYWVDALRLYPHRGIVMVGFSESSEFQRKTNTLPPEVIPASCRTGCVPVQYSGPVTCRMPVHGAGTRVAGGTDVTPYLTELTNLTGVAFVNGSLAEATERGIVIKHVPGQGGSTAVDPTSSHPGGVFEELGRAEIRVVSYGGGPASLVRAIISLYEVEPSVATVRHELGHAFGLDHSSSALMLPAGIDDQAQFSALEQAHLIGLGRRSGCRR